jgi:hypothetical protein
VAHFRGRVVQDALSEATSAYWERRAEAFEGARPTPNEFHGNETREELRGRWLRLSGIAAACRAKARVSLRSEELSAEVNLVLLEELVA